MSIIRRTSRNTRGKERQKYNEEEAILMRKIHMELQDFTNMRKDGKLKRYCGR